MSPLEIWVQTPLAGAVGWTLLHSLWEGIVIVGALGTVLLTMRSPRVRYAAACLAMCLLFIGICATLICLLPENHGGSLTFQSPYFQSGENKIGAEVLKPAKAGLAAVAPWLAPFWMVGVWIFYLWHFVCWVSTCRLVRRGVCYAPEPWQQRLARLRARLRLSRPVRLLESCLLEIPVVIGHFHPLVLMPVGLLAGLPPNQIEVILLHELAHIRRCDYLVNSLQRLMEGLLFYNPAIWWISGVIRHEREKCCDDVAVATSGCAYEYAAALIALEQNRSLRREPAMAVTGGKLMKRIHRLLVPERPTGNWMPLLSTVILVITTTLTLAALQSGPSPAMQPQMSQAKTSPYLKWLDQEVVYIIAAEERAAFLKLATDEERDEFIEQFWSRRDPTPGTPANEFKAEHYRRIALANKRFQTRSGKPGWQTDRGHLYIVYGPPDEIETHPKSAQTAISSESWRYRHLEGMGEDVIISFVDKGQTGDYRLTPENLSKLKPHLPL